MTNAANLLNASGNTNSSNGTGMSNIEVDEELLKKVNDMKVDTLVRFFSPKADEKSLEIHLAKNRKIGKYKALGILRFLHKKKIGKWTLLKIAPAENTPTNF